MDMSALRSAIIERGLKLVFSRETIVFFPFGELHIAGPPCVDYSSMGLQRRERGPTRIIFCGVGSCCSLAAAVFGDLRERQSFPNLASSLTL